MEESKLLIKGARVIDPANNLDEVADILIEGSVISKVSRSIGGCEKIIDATGKIAIPGLVDMHVHLREPGREDKENICSGTKAALRGGVTSILAMPNTDPAMDSSSHISILKKAVEKSAKANVFVCGAITKDRCGQELAQIDKFRDLGVVAISDDGYSVESEELMLEALKLSKESGLLVVCHCEDKTLSAGGVVNRGFTSTRLGLKGISSESEYKRIERDIRLAKKSGAPLHIAHVSCRESVEIIAKAKKEGMEITCETAPHYFALSEKCVLGYDTNFKMNPPLRSEEDMLAVREGLRDGTIDAIASDHAPHTENEKDIEFERAEFGVIGLQTELAVSITQLINGQILTWPELVKKLCLNPSLILKIAKGTLGTGRDADIAIIDPQKEWTVNKENLLSKSKNSAFLGEKLKGAVEYTICLGKVHKWNS